MSLCAKRTTDTCEALALSGRHNASLSAEQLTPTRRLSAERMTLADVGVYVKPRPCQALVRSHSCVGHCACDVVRARAGHGTKAWPAVEAVVYRGGGRLWVSGER